MKKLFTLILITICLHQTQVINAQCTVVVTATPAIICAGDSSFVSSIATDSGSYYTFDFNDNTLPPGWSVSGGATFAITPACAAPTLDNTAFYWSSTSGTTPEIQTSDLDVSAGGSINFEFRFKGNSSSSPCETADQPNEGVMIEYSINSGASWNDIVYFCSVPGYPGLPANQQWPTLITATGPGNGNGSTGIYDDWAPYSLAIPPAAQTTSTRFRWRQPNSSGSCCDNWGLDNINIAAQPNLFYNWNNGYNGFGANTQFYNNIPNDTCIIVLVQDTTTGALCSDTVCITVDALPTLNLSYSNPYCVGDIVTLNGSLSSANISSYQWDLDFNGSFEITGASSSYTAFGTFLTAGNYNITFQGVTPGGCTNNMDTVVRVYNNPNLNLSTLDPTVCIYDTADFNALAFLFNAAGQSSTITNYAWDFDYNGTTDDSGAVLINTSYFFPGLGTYPVVVTVTTDMGCERKDTVQVTYTDIPHGNIVAPPVCGNIPASFTFNNTGLPISDYYWDFGNLVVTNDTSGLAAPNYLYSPGAYTVIIIVSTANGCLDTMLTGITISPLPAGTITNFAICEGHDETFNFLQTSPDSIVSYSWTFPTGTPGSSTLTSPVINFGTSGTISASLIVTNNAGCLDTINQPFLIRTPPLADFGVYPICISRFTFDPMVIPDSASAIIDWNLGDGTVFNNVDTSSFNHIYLSPGDFNAALVITDQWGCQDSLTQLVQVDDSLFVILPNVLVQTSTLGNDKIDFEEMVPGFNLCIDWTYTVFDRWGVQVFKTNNDPYAPDLTCATCFRGKAGNGAVLTPGTYYYVMEGNFNILKSGFITIFE